jgi:hypothetical protein
MKHCSSIGLLVLIGCMFTPAQTAAPDCSSTNQLLSWLRQIQSEVVLASPNYNKPSGGWGVCETTWGNDGTCCNISQLNYLWRARLIYNEMYTISNFVSYLRYQQNNLKKLKEIAGGVNFKAKIDATIADPSSDFKGMTAEQAKATIQKIDNWDTDLKSFKDKANYCINATNNAKSAIICWGCQSGSYFEHFVYPQPNNPSYSYSTLGYMFQSGTCNTVLEYCIPVWSFMFNIQAQIVIALEVRKKDRGGSTDSAIGGSTLPKNKSFGEVLGLFTACPNTTIGANCTQDILDTICGLFVSFKQSHQIPQLTDRTDIAKAVSTRLLQTGWPNEGLGAVSSVTLSGIKLDSESKPFTSSNDVDMTILDPIPLASNTTRAVRSNANTLMFGLLSLVGCILYI